MAASYVDGHRMLTRGVCMQPQPKPLLPHAQMSYYQPAIPYRGGFQPTMHLAKRAVPGEPSSDSGNSTGVFMASSPEDINSHRYPVGEPFIYNNNIAPPLQILSDVIGQYHHDITYSKKVFVGGLPEDVYRGSEQGEAFRKFFLQFGKVIIEYPPRYNRVNRATRYLHVIFENDIPVKNLLSLCLRDAGGRYFLRFNIPYPPINVRPFIIGDHIYTTFSDGSMADRRENTVVIRNVPRHYTARNLAYFAKQSFGPVLSTQINVDSCNYPTGIAILTFGTHVAYVRAIYMQEFEVLDYFRTWDVRVEPFCVFDNRQCEFCKKEKANIFCKYSACLTYWCKACYETTHPEPHFGCDDHDLITLLSYSSDNSEKTESQEEDAEYPPLPHKN